MSCSRMRNDSLADSLQTYLKEIRDESLLTAAEECDLAEAIARGDKDARSRMIQANLRLVVKIARDYVGRGMILEDLIGEGNLGLIRAAEEFQPRFGTRFSTYAAYWIKQSIRHALINTTTTIRLPAHMVGLLTKWRRSERALCRELGRIPSFDEVASHLKLSETQKYLLAKALQARQLKLESNIAFGTDWRKVLGANDRDESPHALLEKCDEWEILRTRLDCLDVRERMILVLRYGLEGETPLTLKEIGRRLGVTREWVRKIEVRAVRKLDNVGESDPSAGRPRSARSRRSSQRSTVELTAGPAGVPGGVKLRPRAASRAFPASSRRVDSPAPGVAVAR
jgi:RNA polymerase primary sigma factor